MMVYTGVRGGSKSKLGGREGKWGVTDEVQRKGTKGSYKVRLEKVTERRHRSMTKIEIREKRS